MVHSRIGAPPPEEPVINPGERRNDYFEDEHDDEDEYDLRRKRKRDRSNLGGPEIYRRHIPQLNID
jgi:hypothetical protein